MAPISNTCFKLINFAYLISIILITGCASVQNPTGGPKDTTPPKILKETPKNLTRNFSAKEIQIEFDEFIKLNNEYKEISISPAVTKLPEFNYKKNVLNIKFKDSLEKNTTYTINFGKAVIDYNAGNILKNYTYVFSTGNVIDSLSISGNVAQTLTKKHEPDISVFIIPTRQDSIFGKKPASIFTTTDSAGNFVLRNLKPDTYRIYALKEQGADRIYNSTNEEIGFQTAPIALTGNVNGVVLETFKEEPTRFITEERKIESDGRLFFKFNQPIDAPALKILSREDLDRQKTVEFSLKGDTALLWLPEITFDSVKIAVQAKGISVDTVTLRRTRRDVYNRALTVKDNANTGINSINNFFLTFSSPVSSFDASKIILRDDTVIVKGLQIAKIPESLRKYKLSYPWKTGHFYTITLAENAFTGPFGGSKFYTSGRFRIVPSDIYGNLSLTVTIPHAGNYIVQLIKDEKDITSSNLISANGKIEYHNISTGKYSIRIIYDANKNGKWDTGNVKQTIQPEKVWNYPKSIALFPNFEKEEPIIIPENPGS